MTIEEMVTRVVNNARPRFNEFKPEHQAEIVAAYRADIERAYDPLLRYEAWMMAVDYVRDFRLRGRDRQFACVDTMEHRLSSLVRAFEDRKRSKARPIRVVVDSYAPPAYALVE